MCMLSLPIIFSLRLSGKSHSVVRLSRGWAILQIPVFPNLSFAHEKITVLTKHFVPLMPFWPSFCAWWCSSRAGRQEIMTLDIKRGGKRKIKHGAWGDKKESRDKSPRRKSSFESSFRNMSAAALRLTFSPSENIYLAITERPKKEIKRGPGHSASINLYEATLPIFRYSQQSAFLFYT